MKVVNCPRQSFDPPHVLLTLYVQVTSLNPPQAAGGVVALFVNTPEHPPLAVVDAKNAFHAASICSCVLHAATVVSVAQFNTTAGAGVIVNVAVAVEPW